MSEPYQEGSKEIDLYSGGQQSQQDLCLSTQGSAPAPGPSTELTVFVPGSSTQVPEQLDEEHELCCQDGYDAGSADFWKEAESAEQNLGYSTQESSNFPEKLAEEYQLDYEASFEAGSAGAGEEAESKTLEFSSSKEEDYQLGYREGYSTGSRDATRKATAMQWELKVKLERDCRTKVRAAELKVEWDALNREFNRHWRSDPRKDEFVRKAEYKVWRAELDSRKKRLQQRRF